MKVQLINGPLHGLEIETESADFIDLLDSKDGKVRRYVRGNIAVFQKEWPDKATRDKELGYTSDNPSWPR